MLFRFTMIEDAINRSMFSNQQEKTFIDKLLGKEDANYIRDLIKKTRWNREDMLTALYMLASLESKLLNLDEWSRYVILKFFVWVREFVKVAELLYDYEDDLELKEKLCTCGGYVSLKGQNRRVLTICNCKTPIHVFKINTRTRRLLENAQRLMEHNVKFLIDLYLNIARTSLSLGATAFIEILKNKYEISYPQMQPLQQPESKGGLFGLRK